MRRKRGRSLFAGWRGLSAILALLVLGTRIALAIDVCATAPTPCHGHTHPVEHAGHDGTSDKVLCASAVIPADQATWTDAGPRVPDLDRAVAVVGRIAPIPRSASPSRRHERPPPGPPLTMRSPTLRL